MGSYYSTNRIENPVDESQEVYPQHPIFHDILFNKFEDFVSKCELSDEKVYNEHGEDPIQYICELGVTQQRYDMLCYLLDSKKYEISNKVITPLLNRNGTLVKCYILRLLLTIAPTVTPGQAIYYSTTSEANYDLFAEYGLSDIISLIPDVQYDLQ